MKARLAVPLPILALILASCSTGAPASASSPVGSTSSPGASASGASASGATASGSVAAVTIYGAASLKGVLAKATTAYEAANPGTTLTISTDSSSALEAKIEQGAPADVFLSADTTNPKKLIDKGLADGAAVTFASNKLTVIVPTPNPAGIKTPADLARAGVKVIAAGDAVPITKYATQLVANLAREAGYPANFVAAYTANIVSREDNASAVVAKIELGEGDAGIVYVTDARASTKVATVDVPAAANVLATYSGVVIKASGSTATARAFVDWLAGPEGRAILSSFGFLPPS